MHIHKVEFYKKSKARFDEDDEFKDRARKEVLALLCVCVCVCPRACVPSDGFRTPTACCLVC